MEKNELKQDTAQHLCVIVHGLWGSPNHVKVMADTLRENHARDRSLQILISKSNCRSLTYDGIEVGGQRLCMEILDEVESLAKRGSSITRLSIAAYSIGGLIARYAIGLLESQDFFHKVDPINFSAFASPFLGTRSPIQGWRGDVINALFPHVFCATGRELFLIDDFRGTGRPLLVILADPDSTFLKGLARFQRRTLYGNIMNDPSTVYYTSTISTVQPYVHPESKVIPYLEGYRNVIVDVGRPVTLSCINDSQHNSRFSHMVKKTRSFIYGMVFLLGMTVFIPAFGTLLFLTYIVQSVLSPRRIYWHQKQVAKVRGMGYALPLISATLNQNRMQKAIRDMQEVTENIFQAINHTHSDEYLFGDDNDDENSVIEGESNKQQLLTIQEDHSHSKILATLALNDRQLTMARNLNNLGWRKYPVHIHKVKRAHAALIMRINCPSFDEGKIVLRHWVEKEFIH